MLVELTHFNFNDQLTASNANFKNGETFTSEFEINEIPPSARTLLTKGYIQDEINSYSGIFLHSATPLCAFI